MMQERKTASAERPDDDRSGLDERSDKPNLESTLQDFIGNKLRAVYDEVVSEPVPDRFAELLKAMDDVPASDDDVDRSGE